ncbi:MAG: hypothetical protein UIT84_04180, partial [Lachnospiraceae bacterium]
SLKFTIVYILLLNFYIKKHPGTPSGIQGCGYARFHLFFYSLLPVTRQDGIVSERFISSETSGSILHSPSACNSGMVFTRFSIDRFQHMRSSL